MWPSGSRNNAAEARPGPRQRGYSTAWDKARAGFLRLHPQCALCAREGLIVAATVVDHITPHRGDQRLFWDQSNWQSLCTNHHSSDKQQVERRGFSSRVAASGLPTDPSHPFYATRGDEASGDEALQRPRQLRPAAASTSDRGSKVKGSKGRGPLGVHRAELVSNRRRRDG